MPGDNLNDSRICKEMGVQRLVHMSHINARWCIHKLSVWYDLQLLLFCVSSYFCRRKVASTSLQINFSVRPSIKTALIVLHLKEVYYCITSDLSPHLFWEGLPNFLIFFIHRAEPERIFLPKGSEFLRTKENIHFILNIDSDAM